MDGSKGLKIGATYWHDGPQGRVQVTLVRVLDKVELDECRWRFNGTYDCVIREDGWHSFLSYMRGLSERK